ncbi:hypothetical protein [Streptomyces sp. NPDC048659]|uniref:hypothetical protein n=1 Tax=Streptomyces sp. NPDC048659 TaxID=3155489 RepID=UPI00343658A0
MSDEFERANLALARALIEVYETLRLICLYLPIPVRLPRVVEYDLNEIVPAVERLIEIIGDQPNMGEEDQSLIWGSAINWTAAAKLYSRYIEIRGNFVSRLELEVLIETAGRGLLDYLDNEEDTSKE